MKKCPSCGRTYADPALNFCLQDGTGLEEDTISTFGNEETMISGQMPPSTNPNRSPYSSPTNPPATWAASPYGAQPRKRKSRAWIFILIAFFAFGLIAVVGFAGFLVYLGVKMDEAKNKNKAVANYSNSNRGKANVNANANIKIETAGDVKKDDFSKWKTGSLPYAKVEFKDGRLIVSSIRSDYLSALPAFADFLSNDAISRVTVKNTTGAATDLGFGLVVNSNPAKALLKDYAFLIRTDGTPSYRVVQHTDSKEKDLVKWTTSSAINDGTDDNELEVRDEGKKLSFYINGDFVASIDDNLGDAKSIAGIYAGSAIPIAFSDLEIEKINKVLH